MPKKKKLRRTCCLNCCKGSSSSASLITEIESPREDDSEHAVEYQVCREDRKTKRKSILKFWKRSDATKCSEHRENRTEPGVVIHDIIAGDKSGETVVKLLLDDVIFRAINGQNERFDTEAGSSENPYSVERKVADSSFNTPETSARHSESSQETTEETREPSPRYSESYTPIVVKDFIQKLNANQPEAAFETGIIKIQTVKSQTVATECILLDTATENDPRQLIPTLEKEGADPSEAPSPEIKPNTVMVLEGEEVVPVIAEACQTVEDKIFSHHHDEQNEMEAEYRTHVGKDKTPIFVCDREDRTLDHKKSEDFKTPGALLSTVSDHQMDRKPVRSPRPATKPKRIVKKVVDDIHARHIQDISETEVKYKKKKTPIIRQVSQAVQTILSNVSISDDKLEPYTATENDNKLEPSIKSTGSIRPGLQTCIRDMDTPKSENQMTNQNETNKPMFQSNICAKIPCEISEYRSTKGEKESIEPELCKVSNDADHMEPEQYQVVGDKYKFQTCMGERGINKLGLAEHGSVTRDTKAKENRNEIARETFKERNDGNSLLKQKINAGKTMDQYHSRVTNQDEEIIDILQSKGTRRNDGRDKLKLEPDTDIKAQILDIQSEKKDVKHDENEPNKCIHISYHRVSTTKTDTIGQKQKRNLVKIKSIETSPHEDAFNRSEIKFEPSKFHTDTIASDMRSNKEYIDAPVVKSGKVDMHKAGDRPFIDENGNVEVAKSITDKSCNIADLLSQPLDTGMDKMGSVTNPELAEMDTSFVYKSRSDLFSDSRKILRSKNELCTHMKESYKSFTSCANRASAGEIESKPYTTKGDTDNTETQLAANSHSDEAKASSLQSCHRRKTQENEKDTHFGHVFPPMQPAMALWYRSYIGERSELFANTDQDPQAIPLGARMLQTSARYLNQELRDDDGDDSHRQRKIKHKKSEEKVNFVSESALATGVSNEDRLTALGFTQAQAVQALRVNDNDVNRAAEWLFSGSSIDARDSPRTSDREAHARLSLHTPLDFIPGDIQEFYNKQKIPPTNKEEYEHGLALALKEVEPVSPVISELDSTGDQVPEQMNSVAAFFSGCDQVPCSVHSSGHRTDGDGAEDKTDDDKTESETSGSRTDGEASGSRFSKIGNETFSEGPRANEGEDQNQGCSLM